MSQIISITGKIKAGKDTVAQIIRQYTDEISQTPTGDLSPYKIYKFADKLKEMTAILIDCRRSDLEDQEFKNTPLPPEWDRYVFTDMNTGNVIDLVSPHATQEELDNISKQFIGFFSHVSYKLESLTPRKILQVLGTQGMRQTIHPDVHVLGTFARISGRGKALITDTRFPNEADACKHRGGLLIKVIRPIDQRHPDEWDEFVADNPDEFVHSEQHFMAWLKDNNGELYATLTHPSETALDTYDGFDYIIVNNTTLADLHKKVEDILRTENIIK